MRDTDFWEQFLSTGKVEDYLKYRFGDEGLSSKTVTSCGRDMEAEDAGSSERDGNDIKADPHRGVRPEDYFAY